MRINSAETVIKTVCKRMRSGNDGVCGKLFRRDAQDDTDAKRADRLLDEYIKKLAGMGQLGLQGPHTSLAKTALDSLKKEFFSLEAGRIKNAYVCSLGLATGATVLLLLAGYALILAKSGATAEAAAAAAKKGTMTAGEWWYFHKNFFLAATGAAIGSWLSFSIRKVDFLFEDLAVVESDLLDPIFRVLFVMGLTLAACLLFWTGAINIEIGNLKTNSGDFRLAGTIPLLVGVFCGLAERALATAISDRAAAFVKGVAGGV